MSNCLRMMLQNRSTVRNGNEKLPGWVFEKTRRGYVKLEFAMLDDSAMSRHIFFSVALISVCSL